MLESAARQHILCILILSVCIFTVCKGQCKTISPCMCQYPDGSRIDLTSLGNRNGTARFSNIQVASEPYTYSYNPCVAFTLGPAGTECKDVAVCQSKTTPKEHYSLGKEESAAFWMNGSQLTINYTSINQIHRKAIVKLICDKSGTTLQVDGEFPDPMKSNYSMTLRSPCACPDECVGAPYPDDSLSTGSLLVILFFTFFLCYLIGGIIFQKIVIGATGRELIPNYEFWIDFPLLVRDGVIFVCNGCQREASYDRI